MDVFEAVSSRYSCRAFLPTPIPEKIVRDIVERAARSPSAGNMQPWRIYAIAGKRVAQLKALLAPRMASELPRGEGVEYTIYPQPLGEPFKSRSFKVGELLYQSIHIPREDKPGALQAVRAQLRILRCARGAVFRARKGARAGAMGRHRRLPADGLPAGAWAWTAHLPATGLGVVSQDRTRISAIARSPDDLFRHGAWLCRRDCPHQRLALPARAARRLRVL